MPTTTAVSAWPICASGARIPDSLREAGNIKGYALKRCPGCELRLFDAQPDDATLADIYKQEYYNAWGLHC